MTPLPAAALAVVLSTSAVLAQQSQQPFSNPQQLYSGYSFNPLEHLAGIAPYFEPEDPPRNPSPPQGCTVKRAAYLVRHAAINANDFDYETYVQPFQEKLGNATVDWSRIPELSFLDKWQAPTIREQERVTRTGKLEAAQLGVQLSYRYDDLRLPKRVWASTAERTTASAQALIRGLEVDDDTIDLVTVYEGDEAGADSLTPYKSCPQYSASAGSDQSTAYVDRYTAPIIARLHALAPAFNWTSNDIVGMFEICGYDSVIRGSSPFCNLDLFSPDEWLQFEYAQDIMYHYNTGYGSELSGALGFPWFNATMSLLASPPETDDQDLYVSFTHRELPPTVLVAMGLFNNSEFTGANNVNATMPTAAINYGRQWRSSYILPFLTNIGIEQMSCPDSFGFSDSDSNSSASDTSTYYRVLVNNSPQTLPGCSDGPLESCSASGMQAFVKSRADMFSDFGEKCQVDYQNSTDVVGFYLDAAKGEAVGR